jgi:bacillithiol synthase
MASEDHDFAEVQSVHLFGKELKWETDQKGAVGRFHTNEVSSLIDELELMKGNFPNGGELISILRKAYSSGNLASATRILVNEIFGEYGLVVIDGDDHEFKKILSSLIEKEITEQLVFPIVRDKNKKLQEEGFDPQVHPREINIFYLGNNDRKRILQNQYGEFSVIDDDKKWSREELITEIHNVPENFSPNVLIRPLYQETILPNIAYIGGPGEISYWKQIEEVFPVFGLTNPVLILRHSAMLIEPAVSSRMKKLGLSEKDIFRNEDLLIRNYIETVAGDEIHLEEYKTDMQLLFTRLSEKAEHVDPTLKPAVLAEQQKIMKYLETLEGKLRKAEKHKHETAVTQIRHVKEKLFPGGVPQERFDSIIPFYLKFGREGVRELKEKFVTFDLRYLIVYTE